MTSLEQLRADQHDDLVLASDHAFAAFLAEVDPQAVRLDMTPRTPSEVRHLLRTRAVA